MPFITKKGLEQLGRYEYRSTGSSPLDDVLNKHLWTPAARLLPKWVAPNVVTFSGLFLMFLAFCLVAYYSPNLNDPVPGWVWITVFISHFAYQTLDAMDGKQARATESSSPLGQLFDHGCDSLSAFLMLIPCIAAMRLGYSMGSVLILASVQFPFFTAQWEEHHTHNMRTVVGYLGVTEGQWTCFIIELLAGLIGNDYWLTPTRQFLPAVVCDYLDKVTVTQASEVIVVLALAGNTYIAVGGMSAVWKWHPKMIDRLDAFAELIPLCVHVALACAFKFTTVYDKHPWLVLTSIGAVFSHLCTQMIICGVTHMRYSNVQWCQWLFALVVGNSYLPKLQPLADRLHLGVKVANLQLDETKLIYGYFVFLVITMFFFLRGVITQLTNFLGIYCFSLGKRPGVAPVAPFREAFLKEKAARANADKSKKGT